MSRKDYFFALLVATASMMLASILAFTGARSGELQRLRVEDVDHKGNWIHIISREGAETKTYKEVKTMMKHIMMIVLVAMAATTSNTADAMVAGSAGAEIPGIGSGSLPMAKTRTTWGQENEVGSQVLADSSLTSPVSFPAEGKGFEPSTPCEASDFESQNGG